MKESEFFENIEKLRMIDTRLLLDIGVGQRLFDPYRFRTVDPESMRFLIINVVQVTDVALEQVWINIAHNPIKLGSSQEVESGVVVEDIELSSNIEIPKEGIPGVLGTDHVEIIHQVAGERPAISFIQSMNLQ